MQLLINGEPHELTEAASVADVIRKLGYESNSIAVAINGEFVPRHQYATFTLQERQELDVVAPMQGG